MGHYVHLATVSVEHQFFANTSGPSLRFSPTAEAAQFMRRLGLLTRMSDRTVSVALDSDSLDALRLEIKRSEDPVFLTFKVFSNDPEFTSYTDPGVLRTAEILCFEAGSEAEGSDGSVPIALHAEEFVGVEDFRPVAELKKVPGLLENRDFLVHPDFVVRLRLRGEDFQSETLPPARDYRIRFRSRQTIWKYFFLGLPKRGVPGITDLGNQTEFEFMGQTVLPGDKTALTFRSKTPIPLRRQHDVRFQLRDKSISGGKVLIRRLPVASAGQFGKDVIDGRETIVSEIYINC